MGGSCLILQFLWVSLWKSLHHSKKQSETVYHFWHHCFRDFPDLDWTCWQGSCYHIAYNTTCTHSEGKTACHKCSAVYNSPRQDSRGNRLYWMGMYLLAVVVPAAWQWDGSRQQINYTSSGINRPSNPEQSRCAVLNGRLAGNGMTYDVIIRLYSFVRKLAFDWLGGECAWERQVLIGQWRNVDEQD